MDGILNNDVTVRRYDAVGRDLHIDVPLTNQTIAYRPQGLIADQIFPIVPVDKETGAYYIWNKGTFLRISDATRARGRAANRIKFDVSSDTYAAKNFALASDLPYEDLSNADAALQLRESAGMFIVDQLNLHWENRLAVVLTTTTNMTSSTALTNAWNDAANGDPVNDIFTGRDAIRKATGYVPNKIIMGDQAWSRFSRHPDIIEFVRGKGDDTGGGTVAQDAVARAFQVDQILVGKGIKNTAAEGQTATFTDIWSSACILLYVSPNPGLMVPSAGYTYRWTPEGLPGPLAVERYDNRREKTESVEVHMFQDEKITGTDLGYLIVGC